MIQVGLSGNLGKSKKFSTIVIVSHRKNVELKLCTMHRNTWWTTVVPSV